jgi:cobalt-zinc-cadmium efflux system membrane fusion protein
MKHSISLLFAIGLTGVGSGSCTREATSPPGPSPSEEAEEHAGHDHGDEERHEPITLDPNLLAEFGIEVAVAGAGRVEQSLLLTGEIVLNPDRLAHIVPRVGGIVREVRATLGDQVREGEVLTVLESSELAEGKAEYLGAQQRAALTDATLQAKRQLRETGIVSELDFLAAQRDAAEAEIALRSADVRIHTYGFTHAQLAHISAEDEEALLVYELRAPFSGIIVEKHIALGELVTKETDVFLVADLDTVWVQLAVHQRDLAAVRPGMKATIAVGRGLLEAEGTIGHISPVVDAATRTAIARVVLPNTGGAFRPGLFVTARVTVEGVDAAVLVPRSAIQPVEGRPVIFVRTHGGFEPREVVVGRTNEQFAEITSGLTPGDEYAAQGAFTLKAELEKASFGGEGHAH